MNYLTNLKLKNLHLIAIKHQLTKQQLTAENT